MPIEIEVRRRLLDAMEELTAAARIAEETAVLDRLARLREALASEALRIAVVGEFGNGKSALVNSLVGQPLVPMGIAPVTRALVEVSHGDRPRASLVYADGVRLETAPNALVDLGGDQVARLDHIEIEVPAPILEQVFLLDAPGLGEKDGVPAQVIDHVVESADCVLCVLNCDRLLSLTERTYIEEKLLSSGAERVCFVLNRSDGKSEEDIAALKTRASHLLEPLAPGARLFPYSALHALQGQLQQDKKKRRAADPENLQEFINREWLGEKNAIRAASAHKKLRQIAEALEESLQHQETTADTAFQEMEASLERSEQESAGLQEQVEAASRRALAGIQGVREQFMVGLKDYALKLRASVPEEVMDVPVDEARRFLPFYIQDSLKRAVDENDKPLRDAVAQVLELVSQDVGQAIRELIINFQVDVEPPAIPLYVARDRAPLSQGASFIMGAAATIMFSETYVGLLMLFGSFMSREIGKQLEAADRRANLAASAQTLVHGSIESMEHSVGEQFKELEQSVRSVIQDVFAPQLEGRLGELTDLRNRRDGAARNREQFAARTRAGREHTGTARQLLEMES